MKRRFFVNWSTEEVHVRTQDGGGWRFFGWFESLQVSHEDSYSQAVAKCEAAEKSMNRLNAEYGWKN